MRILWFVLATCVAATVGGCDADAHKPLGAQQQETDLEKLKEVPPFSFDERSGRKLDNAALKGKVWVTTFIFTNCKTSCVTMSIEMNQLQEEFQGEKDFRIVATSVDPERDTLEVLDKFGESYDADPERWYFMRGEIDEVRTFANEGLMIAWHKDDPLIHSVYFVLVDRDGFIRGYYQQTDPERMKKLRADIRTLLAEKTP